MSSPAVVLDNGTSSVKVGFAGDDTPKVEFPTVVGIPPENRQLLGVSSSYVGEEAKRKRMFLRLKYPITQGVVSDFENMENIWDHAFKELGVSPSDQPLLLSNTLRGYGIKNRERASEILFESLNVPSLSIVYQSLLSLYATGRTTGVVLGSGYDLSYSVAVKDGRCLYDTMQTFNRGGLDVTECLTKQCNAHLSALTSEKDIVEDIKKSVCRVALDYEQEMQSPGECLFTLPDGTTVTLTTESIVAGEALFKPTLIGCNSADGIQKLLNNTILKSPQDLQSELYSNIVLFGGTSVLPGFSERIQQEVKRFAPEDASVHVIADPGRQNLTWKGGALLASQSQFNGLQVSKQEYEEMGPSVINTKFDQPLVLE